VVVLTANGAKLPDGWRERLRCAPSHYELGQLVAELLGWLVRSPEEDPNVLFTNGPDLNGRAGWLRYDRVWEAKGCQLREELVWVAQRGSDDSSAPLVIAQHQRVDEDKRAVTLQLP